MRSSTGSCADATLAGTNAKVAINDTRRAIWPFEGDNIWDLRDGTVSGSCEASGRRRSGDREPWVGTDHPDPLETRLAKRSSAASEGASQPSHPAAGLSSGSS